MLLLLSPVTHLMNDWFYIRQSREWETEASKKSVSMLFYEVTEDGKLCTATLIHQLSWTSTESPCEATCLYFYILSILQRFMFIKCVSHTQVRDDWNVLLLRSRLWNAKVVSLTNKFTWDVKRRRWLTSLHLRIHQKCTKTFSTPLGVRLCQIDNLN